MQSKILLIAIVTMGLHSTLAMEIKSAMNWQLSPELKMLKIKIRKTIVKFRYLSTAIQSILEKFISPLTFYFEHTYSFWCSII